MTRLAAGPVIEVEGVRKSYGGLRPFRMTHLVVGRGERVALSGLDAIAAEILTNLLTGATLPDEGRVTVLGQPTAAIADDQAWLASLDRFGIVSLRAVLLTGSTLAQNLAMPFTLEIDPVPAAVMDRVRGLAAAVGLAPDGLGMTAGAAAPEVQARVHLARAIALDPAVLVMEHPTAMMPRDAVPAFGADLARLASARELAVVAVTEDDRFAEVVAARRLAFDAATGALVARRRWWGGR